MGVRSQAMALLVMRQLGCENAAPIALVERETLYAGRAAECGLRVDDVAVSRKHASVELAGGKAVLRNLKGAAFPVYVNGAAVSQHTLCPGDEVSFQRLDESYATFRFEAAPQRDATVPVRAAWRSSAAQRA